MSYKLQPLVYIRNTSFNIAHRRDPINRIYHIYSKILTNYNYLTPLHHWKYYRPWKKYDPKMFATAGTITDVRMKLIEKMGNRNEYVANDESLKKILKYMPASPEQLPPRTMEDSFASAIIPLSTDLALREKYTTFLGTVRAGRLLEDMDLFAVYVALKHIFNPNLPEGVPTPYVIVTAFVDKIDFTDIIPKHTEDIRLSGHVSWVGQSSLEIVVWLEQKSHDKLNKVTRAFFLMSVRDPLGKKAVPVNKLIGETEEERFIIGGGEERKKKRITVKKQALTKVLPTNEEQKIMHDLFLRSVDIQEVSLKKRNLPKGCVWMENGYVSNLIVSQPENRNLHNKVFGGFLMRQAMELSWALGFLFTKYRPVVKAMSDISFKRPIEVNALIRIHAHIVFTQQNFLEITVYAESWNHDISGYSSTNDLHFIYEVPDIVKTIYPRSYQEFMLYIDGRRHFQDVMLNRTKLHKTIQKEP